MMMVAVMPVMMPGVMRGLRNSAAKGACRDNDN